MTVIAIKALGLLHGVVGLLCLNFAIRAFRLPETDHLPRPRLNYVAGKAAFASLALLACAVAAWQRPSISWLLALIALLGYAPAPSWAQPSPNAAVTRPAYFSLALSARIVGVVLLAIASYSLDG